MIGGGTLAETDPGFAGAADEDGEGVACDEEVVEGFEVLDTG
jgi:hypothetical protein